MAAQGKRDDDNIPPALAEVVAAWPLLDEATRTKITEIVRADLS